MSLDDTLPDTSGTTQFPFFVSGNVFHTRDPFRDGRGILQSAHFEPASDYVLIGLTRPGSRAIGLDEVIDLRIPGNNEFAAFLSDRIFNFTVDELGYVWGVPQITEIDIRRIADTPMDKLLILERGDEPDLVLEPGSSVDLAARGTEHIISANRLITVYYRDTAFELERRIYTGAELSTKFGVPPNYQLDLVKPDGEFREIGPNQPLKVRDGMRFVSHPPCGHSS